MGLNTTIVVLNDGLHEIENDPEFGRKLAGAIRGFRGPDPESFSAGNHCNPAAVIEIHHADYEVLVAVGRNTGRVVKKSWPA